MCFVWMMEQMEIISLTGLTSVFFYNPDTLVHCVVETESANTMQTCEDSCCTAVLYCGCCSSTISVAAGQANCPSS